MFSLLNFRRLSKLLFPVTVIEKKKLFTVTVNTGRDLEVECLGRLFVMKNNTNKVSLSLCFPALFEYPITKTSIMP